MGEQANRTVPGQGYEVKGEGRERGKNLTSWRPGAERRDSAADGARLIKCPPARRRRERNYAGLQR